MTAGTRARKKGMLNGLGCPRAAEAVPEARNSDGKPKAEIPRLFFPHRNERRVG